ncbi:MAG: response regulator [Dysgonamonadaceae bacterium]|nr:response regulator [Dysgonamonadaceae bacterium]
MKKFILILFCCIVYSANVASEKYVFSNLSLKNGLSQLTVLCIHQDKQGFMWFGTRTGLNRFNGYTFDVFLNRPNDSTSISNNHIFSIAEDSEGNLWIGTNNGLNRLDVSTNTFKRYQHNPQNQNSLTHNMIAALLVDSKGDLWVGTENGLNLYRTQTDDFERINPDNFFSNNTINSIAETHDNRLVLGTMYQGLVILDTKNNTHITFRNQPNNPGSLSSDQIRSVFVDSKDNIWIGTISSGLNLLKSADSKNSRASFIKYTQAEGLTNNYIRGIDESPEGNLVVGTFNGLNIIHPFGGIEKYNTYGSERGNLSHYSIFPVYFDRNQTLWIGTYAGGIDYSNPYGRAFRFYDIESELKTIVGIMGPMVESNTDLFIATEGGGLLRFNKQKETFKQYKLNRSAELSYSENIFKSLYVDKGKILCGTTIGTIYSFDPQTEKFSLLYELPEKTPIYVLQRDLAGNLIIGGVNRVGLISISPSGVKQQTFPVQNGGSFSFSDVRSFLETSPGVYLIGTRSEGLFVYDKNKQIKTQYKKTGELQNDELPDNFIDCIVKDSKGSIWIGTFGGGLCSFDEKQGKFKTFNTHSGLLNNNICSIIESENGHLWISSITGITDFNPKNSEYKNYTYSHVININEFSPGSGIMTDNGTVFFGGNNGIIFFNPKQLNINPHIPPVVLERLFIDNEEIIPEKSSPILKKNLNFEKEIVLKHNQSNVSIEYSALNYIFPNRNMYAYKLEGFDPDWNEVGNRRMAYYTNIPPGNYTFKVKASNNDGIWNEDGTSIKITILPPVWETWWAYTLYFVFIIFVLYLIFRYFKEKNRLNNNLRLKQVEVKTKEEFHQARNRLFTNFSHELRTPLTLILSPLDDIVEHEELKSDIKDRLLTMRNNSHRLLRLVNNLMDFQKNESGMLELKVSPSDMVKFVREITLSFSELALSRNINLLFYPSVESLYCLFDKNLMEKVFFNLLSNAIKNTLDNGRVEVRLNTNSDQSQLTIEIEDSGIGIPVNDLEKIFAPFYQVSQSKHAHSGTGLGLSLSKSIIGMHHGKIWAESKGENTGSTFIFTMPVDDNCFKPEEIIPGFEENEFRYTVDTSTDKKEDEKPEPRTDYTLLVVEDNPDVRRYIVSKLSGIYKILEVTNGEEGLTKAFNHLPDLIITDLMMPKMTGVEMCFNLKNDMRTSHIPVIMITARTMPADIQEGYESGADDYIVKPFNSSILKTRIRNILQSREKLKEIYGKQFSLEKLGVKATSLDEKFMQKLYEITEKNISNPELDLNEFYKELGMSRANFYRKIKAITNLSLSEFLRNFRLETAAKLLSESDLPVSEVYVAVGFNSHAYFSNCFKAMYGVSPTEYKQKNNIP